MDGSNYISFGNAKDSIIFSMNQNDSVFDPEGVNSLPKNLAGLAKFAKEYRIAIRPEKEIVCNVYCSGKNSLYKISIELPQFNCIIYTFKITSEPEILAHKILQYFFVKDLNTKIIFRLNFNRDFSKETLADKNSIISSKQDIKDYTKYVIPDPIQDSNIIFLKSKEHIRLCDWTVPRILKVGNIYRNLIPEFIDVFSLCYYGVFNKVMTEFKEFEYIYDGDIPEPFYELVSYFRYNNLPQNHLSIVRLENTGTFKVPEGTLVVFCSNIWVDNNQRPLKITDVFDGFDRNITSFDTGSIVCLFSRS